MDWITKLLEYQASVFAVDVGNYSILSNHQHLIVRLRPDIAKTWSDEEVAWRWKLAWPTWRNGAWSRSPTDEDIEQLLAQPAKILKARENLADLSWFMARWKEPISKLANAESETKGHFYEQRFGSREITDEAGILCCSVYVDLNQMRAGMAQSLEESRCSAIYDRLQAWQQREAQASVDEFLAEEVEGFPAEMYPLKLSQVQTLLADCFLSPIAQNGPLILLDANGAAIRPLVNSLSEQQILSNSDDGSDAAETTENSDDPAFVPEFDSMISSSTAELNEGDDQSSGTNSNSKRASGTRTTWKIHTRLNRRRRRRASNHVFLDMPSEQYLKIVRFSAEQIGIDSPRPPPDDVANVLRQTGIYPSKWISVLEKFETLFGYAIGNVRHLATTLSRTGHQQLRGIQACRDAFS